ncbi:MULTISPECIES: hypothetical protein [Francisella]|uniref:GcvH1, glycine cleavage system protein H n=1 Tax=Francisella opportunistica TaxID=2016517 RepID=A0A345JQR3_9GAMM|nr:MULTISPECIES: hypothetical protein [Francisella]APC91366.1 hypothetical protein BBG19_0630 [Francisella sp. MA067296]AXH29659.1 hypothetical protein CGC43_03240 [Francisella opportunistica]AXH31309.1 hypothetical protein CGC44_03210 [Francisella opportunistica]AXH32956.1 hypothetical protein CGC45_03230 [Francisella opportunistica]
MLARALLTCSLIFLSLSSFAVEQFLNYCKIYNPKKGIEYETHTKTTLDFCKYYLEICNKKYDNKCIAKMNGYQGLYNTNNGLATMHVLYNDDFDKPNN